MILSVKRIENLLLALKTGEGKEEWIQDCEEWLFQHNKNLQIYSWIKKWYRNKCENEGWRDGAWDNSLSDEENIEDYICHKMEYVHAYQWKDGKVIINKYAVQPSFLDGEQRQELLDYLNEHVK